MSTIFVAKFTNNTTIIPDLILLIATGGLWIIWILLRYLSASCRNVRN